MRIGDYETHPAADVFPMMEGDEFKKLVEDIREHGLHNPIVRIWVDDPMCHGQRKPLILDGRNRLRAAYEACIKPTFTDYEGDDPVGFVASMNINRRQLDKSQVALALAKLANMANGSNQHRRVSEGGAIAPPSLTLDEAAEKAKVSREQIKRAKSVLKRGAPELVEAVERGDVSISAAAEVARLPEPEQRIVAAKGADAVTAKAAEIREERKAKAELPEPDEEDDDWDEVVAVDKVYRTIRSALEGWPEHADVRPLEDCLLGWIQQIAAMRGVQ